MAPFVKGTPRHPNAGRKVGSLNKNSKTIRDILLPLTPLAYRQLRGLLQDPDPNVRMKAITEVFDRTYGKAPQAVKLSGGVGIAHVNLESLNDNQLESLFALLSASDANSVEGADPAGAPAAIEHQEDGGDPEGR